MINDLLIQLQSRDPAERRKAIIALANTRDRAALKPLADTYRNDPDPQLREMALKAGRYIQQYALEPSTGAAHQETSASEFSSPFGTSASTSAAREERPITAKDREMARSFLDAAAGYATSGDRARAIEHLGKALSLNPELQKESFVINLTMSLTGLPLAQALPLLIHPDRRAALIAGLGEKPKRKPPQTHGAGAAEATWTNVLIDLGLYWLVMTLSLIAILVFSLDLLRDLIETYNTTTTTTTTLTTADIDALFDLSIAAMIIGSMIYSVYYVIVILLYGGAIHMAATMFLGGNGALVYLYRRIVPLNTGAALLYAAIFVIFALIGAENVSSLSPLIGLFSLIASIGFLYLMIKAVGEVYNFGAGSGCVAIILGTVLLIVLSCCAIYGFTSLAGGTIGAAG